MTCIVGLEQDGKVYIGGDSASSSGTMVRTTAIEKVFKRGPFLIGYTSSFRMGQILHHVVDFPETEIYDEAYMVNRFVEAVRMKLKELGYAKIQNNEETGGTFLVGVAGKIWQVDDDFQVAHYADGIYAIGSGDYFAFGALKALDHLDPKVRLLNALTISSYFCRSVKPPFTILEM